LVKVTKGHTVDALANWQAMKDAVTSDTPRIGEATLDPWIPNGAIRAE